MIQAVVNPAYRSGLGMHYTSVPNIMKVIEPLFLNELYEEFEKQRGNDRKLRELIFRISKLKIFDPACGSGNFLIIAYKELRRLEIEIIKEISGLGEPDNYYESQSKIHFTKDGHKIFSDAPQAKMNFKTKQFEIWFTEIKLSQFYGIELDDFAHEMAILSLWLAEHQMNKEFVDELHDFGRAKPILPLKEAGHITQGNATRLNWENTCPKKANDEIYILGNPPYLGSSLQDIEQKKDMAIVFSKFKNFKNLDYIACWFKRGADFIQHYNAKLAFVSTNSICQGEQVELLWPQIINRLAIFFAHQSFKWTNNAKGNAGVSVVIIGLCNHSNTINKCIIFKEKIKAVQNINPYLTEGSNLIVGKRSSPISILEPVSYGSKAVDGGFLVVSDDEKAKIIKSYPELEKYLKRFVGSNELIKDLSRWCFWIEDEEYQKIKGNAIIKKRLDGVYQFRKKSKKKATREIADIPYAFGERRYSKKQSVIIPSVSSEKREYIPIDFFDENTVISNSAHCVLNATPITFGIISSKIHLCWIKAVCGALESRIRYSSTLGYNTFPFPEINQKQKEQINLHVFAVLEEREKHSGKTLAQLYDPDKMPKGLKEAHHQLDLAIERCYRLKRFDSDTERLEYLFKEYEKMINKNTLLEKPKRIRKKKA